MTTPRRGFNGRIAASAQRTRCPLINPLLQSLSASQFATTLAKQAMLLCGAVLCCALLPPAAQALNRAQLGVIVNTRDPQSVAVAEYYAKQRHIPADNIIRVSFTPIENHMTRARFDLIRAQVVQQTLPHIQAYAITWTMPYRVECMSITSALTFGFDPSFCADGCHPTRPSPYFNATGRMPFTQHGTRPAMLIAGRSFEDAKALIDRGIASEGTFPSGTAYLLTTSDGSRNVRSVSFPLVEKMLRGPRVRASSLMQDELLDAQDVLFYFTGKSRVEGLDTLRFMPGAVADHLTSFGGDLMGNGQMSALRWLEAGATGSYGTVVEPCNMREKFPFPPVVIQRYLRGETLIEAYWKSVLMPGQGVFIGEPLAAPYRQPGAH